MTSLYKMSLYDDVRGKVEKGNGGKEAYGIPSNQAELRKGIGSRQFIR